MGNSILLQPFYAINIDVFCLFFLSHFIANVYDSPNNNNNNGNIHITTQVYGWIAEIIDCKRGK